MSVTLESNPLEAALLTLKGMYGDSYEIGGICSQEVEQHIKAHTEAANALCSLALMRGGADSDID